VFGRSPAHGVFHRWKLGDAFVHRRRPIRLFNRKMNEFQFKRSRRFSRRHPHHLIPSPPLPPPAS